MTQLTRKIIQNGNQFQINLPKALILGSNLDKGDLLEFKIVGFQKFELSKKK